MSDLLRRGKEKVMATKRRRSESSTVKEIRSGVESEKIERMQKKIIEKPCQVRFDDLKDPVIKEIFEFQGCVKLLSEEVPCFSDLTYLFFVNLRDERGSHNKITTFLKGKTYNIDEETLAIALELPLGGRIVTKNDTFRNIDPVIGWDEDGISKLFHGKPGMIHSHQYNQTTLRVRTVLRILSNLSLKAGNWDNITYSNKVLAFYFLAKVKVNIPHLILEELLDAGFGPKNLGFSRIVSKLMDYWGVDMTGAKPLADGDPYSQKNVRSMISKSTIPLPELSIPEEERFQFISPGTWEDLMSITGKRQQKAEREKTKKEFFEADQMAREQRRRAAEEVEERQETAEREEPMMEPEAPRYDFGGLQHELGNIATMVTGLNDAVSNIRNEMIAGFTRLDNRFNGLESRFENFQKTQADCWSRQFSAPQYGFSAPPPFMYPQQQQQQQPQPPPPSQPGFYSEFFANPDAGDGGSTF